ncbi:phage tail protein [Oceanobacillus sojae]|uniref:phage tail protein n=1 Tax=Oceanobacillus sojae TaxID=582851 RepID=UPI003640B3FA
MYKINGQPALFLLDLKGKEYPAIAEVNRKKRVNGQREISLSFFYDQINQDFIHDIEFGWKILFKGEWYTITSPSYVLDGNKFSVGVDAVLSFFVDLNGHYLQDEVQDKSMTPANFFIDLFNGTGYSFILVDNLSANTLNYQANQSKTERFLYGIDRFNAEYVIRGKVAYIYGLIGSDKDVILHEDLNIQDVSIEVDASGFHTWAKGFGDKDENQEDADYKLEVEEYIPALVEKYGWIEGPAIRDGSYKHETNLRGAVKKQIENSLNISTTVTAVDLTNNGYPEMQFEEGDRVWLYVTDLKQNHQVRVVEIDETFDWEGNIISAQYTVGNEGIAARYKTQQYNTIKDFKDIAAGRKTLNFSWLPEAIRRASDIINGNIDSHFKYGAGEIVGINKSNPNGYMRFNTDGLGFSRDGGKNYGSAITYEGVNTNALTAGAIYTNNIRIVGNDNYFYWDGNELLAIDPDDTERFVSIKSKGLYIAKGAMTIERPDGPAFIQDGIARFSHAQDSAEPSFTAGEVEVYRRFWRTNSTTSLNCQHYTFMHSGRYLVLQIVGGMEDNGRTSSGMVEIVSGIGGNIMHSKLLTQPVDEASSQAEYHTARIDLGVPTYNPFSYYIRLRTGAANRHAYVRKIRAWIEG